MSKGCALINVSLESLNMELKVIHVPLSGAFVVLNDADEAVVVNPGLNLMALEDFFKTKPHLNLCWVLLTDAQLKHAARAAEFSQMHGAPVFLHPALLPQLTFLRAQAQQENVCFVKVPHVKVSLDAFWKIEVHLFGNAKTTFSVGHFLFVGDLKQDEIQTVLLQNPQVVTLCKDQGMGLAQNFQNSKK